MAKMEGMDVDDNAAEMLVEANGNDIRQVWGTEASGLRCYIDGGVYVHTWRTGGVYT